MSEREEFKGTHKKTTTDRRSCPVSGPPQKACEDGLDRRRRRRKSPCDNRELPALCDLDFESFRAPQPLPEPPEDTTFNPPGTVLVGNDPVSAECPDFGHSGLQSVTLGANAITRLLTEPSAALLQTTKDELTAQAQTIVEGSLDCFYVNTAQTASCPSSAITAGSLGSPSGVASTVVVPAGRFRSYISQAVANEQAKSEAEARLVCAWGNDEVVVKCPIFNGFEVPGTKTITVEGSVDTPNTAGGFSRVGAVTVDADSVFSFNNKEEANALAENLANSSLQCLWLNDYLEDDCPPGAQANGGAKVVVEANIFPSTANPTEANEQAETFLQSQLQQCRWDNESLTATAVCPPLCDQGIFLTSVANETDRNALIGVKLNQVVFQEDTSVYWRLTGQDPYTWVVETCQPAPEDSAVSVTIEPGRTSSYVSQADANAQSQTLANAIAKSALFCLPTGEFCNEAGTFDCCPTPTTGLCVNGTCSEGEIDQSTGSVEGNGETFIECMFTSRNSAQEANAKREHFQSCQWGNPRIFFEDTNYLCGVTISAEIPADTFWSMVSRVEATKQACLAFKSLKAAAEERGRIECKTPDFPITPQGLVINKGSKIGKFRLSWGVINNTIPNNIQLDIDLS